MGQARTTADDEHPIPGGYIPGDHISGSHTPKLPAQKKPFPLPALSSFARTGPTHLPVGCHIHRQDLLDLEFDGVEFGLWMSDGDFQAVMDEQFARTRHGRHSDTCEMFARAFDCYVADKLRAGGISNPYLTAHAESFVFSDGNGKRIYAVPMGDERGQIFERYDRMIRNLKELGLFHGPDSIEKGGCREIDTLHKGRCDPCISRLPLKFIH